MNPDARVVYRIGGCLSVLLGVAGLVAAAPAFLLGLFPLGFNDNGSADGYETGHDLLSSAQWLGYGGTMLLVVGLGLFVTPWFVPDRPAGPPDAGSAPEPSAPER